MTSSGDLVKRITQVTGDLWIVMVEHSVLPQAVPWSRIAFPVPPLFPTFPLSVSV